MIVGSSYQGDISVNQTLDFFFTTANTSEVPTVLAGTPALSVYKANSATQTTTGASVVSDFDSVVGLNQARIVTTDAFYAPGNDYQIVITTGTINSVSAVGFVVGTFSIENRYSPAMVLDTTIATLASQVSFTLTNGPPDDDAVNGCEIFIVDATTELQVSRGTISDYVGTSKTVTLESDPGIYTIAAGDRVKIFVGGARLDATVSSRLAKGTSLVEGYAVDGSAFTLEQSLYMIWSALAEFAVSGTTIVAKKLDGSTTAMTFTLDDSSNPTSRTRAT